jgi:hypothetical protein
MLKSMGYSQQEAEALINIKKDQVPQAEEVPEDVKDEIEED